MELKIEQKINEILGSSFSLEVKTALRMGHDLTKDLYRMRKLLDTLFIKGLISRHLYKKQYLISISAVLQRSMSYVAQTLTHSLPGSLTNIQAISQDNLSMQRSNVDDRDLLANLPASRFERFIHLVDEHLRQLEEIKASTTTSGSVSTTPAAKDGSDKRPDPKRTVGPGGS